MENIDDNKDRKCSIRGAGNSYHVQYIMNEPDGYETRNLTHVHSYSEDEFGEDEIEIGWVVEPDESTGLAMLQFFEGDGEIHALQRLSPETLFQLADMFTLIANRTYEARADAEAKELAEQVETARMHQNLPFDREN